MPIRTVFGGLAGIVMLALLAGACGAYSEPSASRSAGPEARSDLYQCEGCEGALERNPASLSWTAPVGPGVDRGEPLRLEGIVYRADGQTPGQDVIIYAYQTNAQGLYANGSGEAEASRRHGRLRGWVKTGADGRYRFETIKPAPYPRNRYPAHIHLTILEPGRRPYWIDDVVFEGEFGVTDAYRASMTNRGGNGIVRLRRNTEGLLIAQRDIRLEQHPVR
jgi:protocatechuate 3,4-dioxygenase beta subunit